MKLTGRVLTYHAHYYTVEVLWPEALKGRQLTCFVRGVLKKRLAAEKNSVLVGDIVALSLPEETLPADTAIVENNAAPENNATWLEDILPRQNLLDRPRIANVSQVLVVHSLAQPAFDFEHVDRLLTLAALAKLPAILCITKCDYSQENPALKQVLEEALRLYQQQLGLAVYTLSTQPANFAPAQQAYKALKAALNDQVSVLAGPSGVGKSSLLNMLNPDWRLPVQVVSSKLARGQHTTRHVCLLRAQNVAENLCLADTPGFSYLKFDTVLPQTLEAAYPDFAPYRAACRFDDCLHHLEAEACGVWQALQAGKLTLSRYNHYQRMLAEAQSYKQTLQATSQKTEAASKDLALGKGQKPQQIVRLKQAHRQASRRVQKQQDQAYTHQSAPDDE